MEKQIFTYESEVDAKVIRRRVDEVDPTPEYPLVLVGDRFDFQPCEASLAVHLEIRSISEVSAHGPVHSFVQIAAGVPRVQPERERQADEFLIKASKTLWLFMLP